jgi:hypothetical protein
MRVKDGVFTLSLMKMTRKHFPLAGYLAGDPKYHIGYYSAMQIHDLIPQPALMEQIVHNL